MAMPPVPRAIAFATPAAFRAWLKRNGSSAKELIIRCLKTHAREKGMTYRQALDEALCFGWIDGVRRSLDDDTFTVRFTPRRPRSKWSNVNVRRAKELEAEGRMSAAGLAAFRARSHDHPVKYSFESRTLELEPAFAKRLRANRKARSFFAARPPWYRRTTTFWVMSAKHAETRARRFGILLEFSARGATVPPLTRPRRPAKRTARR